MGFGFQPPDRRRYRRPREAPRPPDTFRPSTHVPSVAAAAAAPVPRPPVPPDYAGQAQGQVAGILDPQLAYIANKYGAQAQGVSNAYGGLTSQYASRVAQAAGGTGAMYGQAEKSVSGAAQGINAQLTTLGQQTAGQESGAMAAASQQGSQSPDINLAQTGKGAGGAAGAIGDAAIQALTSAQKAAMEYAGKLPGFAKLEGDSQTKSALSALSAEMADQLAKTTAEAPQLYYTIYQNLLDRAEHDKEFAFKLKQYGDQRAGIVSSNAPTNAGRLAYWQAKADAKTNSSGQEWVGTTTGIRPKDADPKKAGIQPSYTAAQQYAYGKGTAKAQADAARAQADKERADASRRNAQTAASKATTSASQAATKEAHRHAEALQNIATAEKAARTKAQQAALTARRDAETRRHNRASEAISRSKKKGSSSGGGTFNPATGQYGG